MSLINIKETVIRGGDLLNKGKFDYDRTKVLNASEAGGCIRRQWYQAHNPELEEEQDWGFARRGQHGEKYVVETLLACNVPLRYAGDEQQTLHDADRKISATPDGLIDWGKDWLAIEIKTIDPRKNRNYLPTPSHITQLQIGMELLADQIPVPEDVTFDGGVVVYMDASNYHDIITFDIERDRGILDRMKSRADKKLKTRNVASLDREGKKDGQCRYCGFTEVCGVDLSDAGKTTRANRGSSFDAAAVRYMAIGDEVKALDGEKSDLKEGLKAGLVSRKKTELKVGDILVSLSTVKGRESFDRKAAEKAGIDLAPFTKTGSSSERLALTRV